jgi:hypothetical protein
MIFVDLAWLLGSVNLSAGQRVYIACPQVDRTGGWHVSPR